MKLGLRDEIFGLLTQAQLSASLEPLFDKSKSKVKVETKFIKPPSLNNLSNLLSIIEEESKTYTVFPVRISFGFDYSLLTKSSL